MTAAISFLAKIQMLRVCYCPHCFKNKVNGVVQGLITNAWGKRITPSTVLMHGKTLNLELRATGHF